jgi:glycosyltransferase involved in cell wall biosynthesis
MDNPSKLPTATICLSPNSGGMEYNAIAIAENMTRCSSRSILVSRADTWLTRKGLEHGLEVQPLIMKRNINPFAALRLRRLWRRHNIGNIVYLGSSEMPTIFLSLLGLKINLIVRHGTTKHRSKKDFMHRFTWSKVRAHWCISQHLLDNVKNILPVAGKACFAAYTSQSHKFPDIPLASPGHVPDQPLELVHIGRLQKDKGQRDAIRVVANLTKSGVSANLTLYGEGDDRPYLENMTRELKLEKQVNFKGDVYKPYQYLSQYDAFVFPSYGEGLPNAFLEAAYAGLPCFVYENTVFPELLKLGLKFKIVQQGDSASMAQLIFEQIKKNDLIRITENRILLAKVFCIEEELNSVCGYLV